MTLSLAELNERRRRAVELRLAGETVAATASATGLSAPTIAAASKAYRGGGWAAVPVAPRGRRKLELEAAPDARTVSASSPAGTSAWRDGALQDIASVREALRVAGTDAGTATVRARLVESGLLPPNLHRAASRPGGDASGRARNRFAARARAAGRQVLWVGSRTLADGRAQLWAHDARGRCCWMTSVSEPDAAAWRRFLEALASRRAAMGDGGLALVAPHPRLAGEPLIAAWLESSGTPLMDAATDTITAPARATNPETTTETPMTNDTPERATEPAMTPKIVPARGARGLTHLERLEAESIHIMREVVAEADKPVMLYSIGKDSAVMLHLARKAFFPAPPPFPLLHVDTTWKFQAMYEFRETIVRDYGLELIRHVNEDGVAQGVNPFTHGSALHTDIMKTEALKQALDEHGFDIAFGGARRDEEKSRAKERVFSFRSAAHRWEPKNQRPELWQLYNARKRRGESIRVFPISNWTELDVWQYIHRENIPIVPLYLAAERPVVRRDGQMIMVDDDRMPLNLGEVPEMRRVRFRTLGCYPLTGAVDSDATTLPQIIQEMLLARTSERQGRMIDHDAAASMEKKKQEGYF